MSQDAKIIDLAIRLLFLGLFAYAALAMVTPLAGAVIWAGILCVALYPAFDWLQKKLGGRKSLATTILVLLGLVLTLGPVAKAATGAVDMAAELSDAAQNGQLKIPPAPEGLKEIPLVGSKLDAIWGSFERNLDAAMAEYGPQVMNVAKTIVGKVFGIGLGLLGMALSVVIMGVMFGHGPSMAQGLQRFANRIFAPRGGEFVTMAGATIRNVTKGVIGVAFIQAFVVWALLAAFGFKSALTLAFISLILSIIQIGPGLILLPAIIYAWSSMSGGAALLFTVLAIPTTLMDGVLRPVFISKGLDTPMLVILIGVIGGMMAYGMIGIFMGPVLFAVFFELFKMWIASEPEASPEQAGEAE